MAAVTTSKVGARMGCLACLCGAGRRSLAHQNNSTKYWASECSTTMPNHHTSSRIITSTVHHTSANNFIRAHLNRSVVAAQSLNGVGISWPRWMPPTPPRKKYLPVCLIYAARQLGDSSTPFWSKTPNATCLITAASTIHHQTIS